jgi:hypothetical protein
MFIRDLTPPLIAGLRENRIFNNKLLPDIISGHVFPAIRKQRVDFYFKGGKLFSYSQSGLATHVKYATTPDENSKNYVTENDFVSKCMKLGKDFEADYEQIKSNCELYSKGTEAACVSCLYNRHSFMNPTADIMVLDIEISFESDEDDREQDRIDVLLFSRKERALKFVEAKLYANKEIRSKTRPAVIDQIATYNRQIKKNDMQILQTYQKYVKILQKLFNVSIEEPEKIRPTTGLYIFDFDDDQKKGSLRKITQQLQANNIRYYCKGNPKSVVLRALWDKVH